MSNSKIWEAISQASARDLFDFALTLEANFSMQRLSDEADGSAEIADGELAAFLFQTADDRVEPASPNIVEVKP
ncbi:hypothetical protein [Yoonia sp. BS5-3]|uniref:Uncharacterized protein n=1 Tax=Yoonia phaeophyticola TaxID=3137369 RepID=A0ABZ2V3R6_9RHOB